jgi:hypothetical protein
MIIYTIFLKKNNWCKDLVEVEKFDEKKIEVPKNKMVKTPKNKGQK